MNVRMFIYFLMTRRGNRIFTKHLLNTHFLVTKAKTILAFSSSVACLKYINTHVNMWIALQSSFVNKTFRIWNQRGFNQYSHEISTRFFVFSTKMTQNFSSHVAHKMPAYELGMTRGHRDRSVIFRWAIAVKPDGEQQQHLDRARLKKSPT